MPKLPSKSPVAFQFSTKAMTMLVVCQNGVIIKAAPIVRKFIGQPTDNLTLWMMRQGNLSIHNLDALR